MANWETEPPHIMNLLDPETHHNCYFLVGDPALGTVERIGVVSAMLMAHSFVLRKVLSTQETDLGEQWDIPISDIQPQTFKNMLKFAYGFNNIKSHSMNDAVDLLNVANKLIMPPLLDEVAAHIRKILNPVNVCLALQHPVCLHVEKVEQEIAKVIHNNTVMVLRSRYFHLICPESMRYIVLLESVQVSQVDMWRAVFKWARQKFLNEPLSMNESLVESYVHPKLLVPQPKNIRLCMLNIIRLVEEVYFNDISREDYLMLLSKYHFIANNPPRELFVCTQSIDDKCMIHEMFEVKVIHDCTSWVDMILSSSSEIIINTTGSCIELYSVVCTGIRATIEEMTTNGEMSEITNFQQPNEGPTTYECRCTVRTSLTTDSEEDIISEVNFREEIMYNDEFEILLNTNNELLKLQPNCSYKLKTIFSTPHPVWYTNDIDYFTPNRSNDLDVGCGFVNKSNLWYGSHVKFFLYRPVCASEPL